MWWWSSWVCKLFDHDPKSLLPFWWSSTLKQVCATLGNKNKGLNFAHSLTLATIHFHSICKDNHNCIPNRSSLPFKHFSCCRQVSTHWTIHHKTPPASCSSFCRLLALQSSNLRHRSCFHPLQLPWHIHSSISPAMTKPNRPTLQVRKCFQLIHNNHRRTNS